MSDFLPYGSHLLDDDDIAAVVDVLRAGPLTNGPKIQELEASLCATIGAPEVVVVSNGTTALHLAAVAAGLRFGDQAIVPAITFLSTANVVRMCGADVVFADVDPKTGLITPETLGLAIRRSDPNRLKAVFPVAMNGQCEDWAAIYGVCQDHNLIMISDNAHALGAHYKAGGNAGDCQYEDFATFSFHPVKSIAMGEGGAITVADKEMANRLRRLRSHGMERDPSSWSNNEIQALSAPWYYEAAELGYNYRATDFQAALALSQLKKLDFFMRRRRQIADRYAELFAEIDAPVVPMRKSEDCESAWHLYPVLIDFDKAGLSRSSLMQSLQAEGIGTQVHYIPVSQQPYYKALYGEQELPGVEAYYGSCLSLPIFPAMKQGDEARVVEALRLCINNKT